MAATRNVHSESQITLRFQKNSQIVKILQLKNITFTRLRVNVGLFLDTTSLLVTDVGGEMCWLQLVTYKFEILVIDIPILSPTSPISSH